MCGVELSKRLPDNPGSCRRWRLVTLSEVPKVPRTLSSAGFTPVTQEDFSNNVAVGTLVCHFSFSEGRTTADLFFTTDETVGGWKGEE